MGIPKAFRLTEKTKPGRVGKAIGDLIWELQKSGDLPAELGRYTTTFTQGGEVSVEVSDKNVAKTLQPHLEKLFKTEMPLSQKSGKWVMSNKVTSAVIAKRIMTAAKRAHRK